jgi:hypothetical protein
MSDDSYAVEQWAQEELALMRSALPGVEVDAKQSIELPGWSVIKLRLADGSVIELEAHGNDEGFACIYVEVQRSECADLFAPKEATG